MCKEICYFAIRRFVEEPYANLFHEWSTSSLNEEVERGGADDARTRTTRVRMLRNIAIAIS